MDGKRKLIKLMVTMLVIFSISNIFVVSGKMLTRPIHIPIQEDLEPQSEIYMHKFTVNAESHLKYGLAYPVTYIFDIGQQEYGLKAYHRHTNGGIWEELPEKTGNELFSGIEAVRFEYGENKAYVSVGFSDESDNVFINIVNSYEKSISSEFLNIAEYYDDRSVAVTISGDDWQSKTDSRFVQMANLCQERQLWFTVGLVTQGMYNDNWYGTTDGPNWTLVQQEIDEGFVEPGGHSRTHPHDVGSEEEAISEILGCKQDIVDNLTLPDINRNGNIEYVYPWIEPYGWFGKYHRYLLGEYGFISERTTSWNYNYFSTWDPIDELYNRVGVTAGIGSDLTTNADYLNSRFDQINNNGGIYHVYCHPWKLNFYPGSYLYQHLDHISNHTNVWYAGFGHLYVYHYMRERDIINHETLPGNIPPILSYISPTNDATDVSIDTAITWMGRDLNDNDTIVYAICIGIYQDNLQPVALVGPFQSEETIVTFSPDPALNYDTKYFWKIIAIDNLRTSTEGPVWSFTTEELIHTTPTIYPGPNSRNKVII